MAAPIQLDYGRPPRFQRINWKRSLKFGAVCLVLAYLVLTFIASPTRTSISICNKCGIEEKTTAYCFPYTSITFRRSRAQFSTPLSDAVQKHHLHTGHSHQFVFALGPNGEIGPAFGVMSHLGARHAQFIGALATFYDQATAELWLDRFLTRDMPWHSMKIAIDPPPETEAEFKQWWDGFNAGSTKVRIPSTAILDDFTSPKDGQR